jgi:hypothetical protein
LGFFQGGLRRRQLIVDERAARLTRGQLVFKLVEIDERECCLGIVGGGGLNLTF